MIYEKKIACFLGNVLVVPIILLIIVISLLELVEVVLGELVRMVEKPRPSKQASHCGVEESSKISDICENNEVTRTKEQSVETDPQVFEVVQEKQIEAKTATARHVFIGDDATITNSRPFDSSEKVTVPPPKFVESIVGATLSERARVDSRLSDVLVRRETAIPSLSRWRVCLRLKPNDFMVSVGIANFKRY